MLRTAYLSLSQALRRTEAIRSLMRRYAYQVLQVPEVVLEGTVSNEQHIHLVSQNLAQFLPVGHAKNVGLNRPFVAVPNTVDHACITYPLDLANCAAEGHFAGEDDSKHPAAGYRTKANTDQPICRFIQIWWSAGRTQRNAAHVPRWDAHIHAEVHHAQRLRDNL